MTDLSDRVVTVTGASGNLGQAVARAFLAAGAHLALTNAPVTGSPTCFPSWLARLSTC